MNPIRCPICNTANIRLYNNRGCFSRFFRRRDLIVERYDCVSQHRFTVESHKEQTNLKI